MANICHLIQPVTLLPGNVWDVVFNQKTQCFQSFRFKDKVSFFSNRPNVPRDGNRVQGFTVLISEDEPGNPPPTPIAEMEKTMKLLNATRVLCLAAFVSAMPATLSARMHVSTSQPASPKVADEVTAIRNDEGRLIQTFDELYTLTNDPLLTSYESHAAALNQAREEVNNAGASLKALMANKTSMTDKEFKAIEANSVELNQVATRLENLILKLNGNRSYRLTPAYRNEIKSIGLDATTAHNNAKNVFAMIRKGAAAQHKAS